MASTSASPAFISNPSTAASQLNGTFQIHYFASAFSFTGKATEPLPAPLPVHKLFDILDERYPVSVGLEYVDADGEDDDANGRIIQAGEEVAIIPPVSSG
ncbi:molybdopterin synthase small subunit CnxG [Coccidioides immitis H538.4]|uniref:Molybdopterin synthase small subunit CnxG n=2 Tax=Coccidioides immitis TaxID=5501 RepID=A0A0J8R2P7_COCIT|nr:molybdopterin synthase small subunit CnxG [Coccidioides immitis RMSCC 3703]KMU90393.1 molybdopterin synthase small subunit CnxG [Coccidioides immitis H538.4]